ncbi:MAG: methylated-DNA--[protein]-cysteine S-methyltransferase [Planctomycetes bacterium]|nr:methylated-DNA--[protein]-cysteine S-methyltransferase [Planctomycetota bacterium]
MPVKLIHTKAVGAVDFVYSQVPTSWGNVALVGDNTRLYRLIMPGYGRRDLKDLVKQEFPTVTNDPEFMPVLQAAVSEYFHGESVKFNCPVDISWATPFGRQVLLKCTRIKPGKSVSYGQLAQQVGRSKAARAVGTIMAHNRTPLIIPCHRVVRENGAMGGYSTLGGIEMKKRLLKHESMLYKPDKS